MRPLTLLLGCLLISTPLLAQIPSYVPTDGLVAWYPFNGSADDESGNNHHGVTEGTTLTTDRFGDIESALHFNGIDDELDMPAYFNTGWEEFTMSGWFSTDDFNKANQTIVNTNPHNGIVIGFNHPATLNHTVSLWLNSNPAASSWDNSFAGHNPITFANNDWHHISLTKIGLIYVLKVDGNVVFETTVAITPVDYTCAIILGHIDVASGEYFKGTLDDFGFWNRALTEEELDALISGAGIVGCTDPTACNFDADANVDNGSCLLVDCETLCGEGTIWNEEIGQCVATVTDLPSAASCGAGTHWDSVTEMCIADVPSTTDENCTVMNLQELAEGYQVLLDHTADQDSIILALQDSLASCADGPATADSQACEGGNHITYHGYDYAIVEIGDQCWFAENLRTSLLADGTAIPLATASSPIPGPAPSYYKVYDDNPDNAALHGHLYSWHTVNDPLGLCPTGWSVAELGQFESLMNNFGGTSLAGVQLKAGAPIWNGNNDSGFNAFPSGYHSHADSASDYFIGQYGYLWTSTSSGSNTAYYILLREELDAAQILPANGNTADEGMSVRCVKD